MHLGKSIDAGSLDLAHSAQRPTVFHNHRETMRPLGDQESASPTVVCGATEIALSYTGCDRLTLPITSATTSVGIVLWHDGDPRRGAPQSQPCADRRSRSYWRRRGAVWYRSPSVLRRSTSSREVIAERRGTMKTSE